jgi:Mg2+-importing ATPase
MRDGLKIDIPTKYIVPGDVVCLSAGDIVPADGRLICADDFFVNESILTGESFPVEKNIANPEANQVFSGTNVVSGYASFMVTATGQKTNYGQIAKNLDTKERPNAFEIGIKNFGVLIIKVILFIVTIIFLINAITGKDVISSIIFSIAVAVGVTPELLPMIMSFNMSRGAVKMAKKGVLVKRLNAIPDFGSMDILCTDKTGTLTQDKITVVKYLNTTGADDEIVLKYAYINGAFETGIKSVLDHAILNYKKFAIDDHEKVNEIPYDFMRKRSTIVYKKATQKHFVTKGAPEEVFKICTGYLENAEVKKITAPDLKKFNTIYDELSASGFRVLAIAIKNVDGIEKDYKKEDEKEMTLAGFIAFYDPPKPEAKATVDFMEKHGIEMKILTGDGALVAKKVCDDLKIPIKGIITGEDFDINKMNDKELLLKAQNNNIFARFSPMQKEKIIQVLKEGGNVVGYLGDGINDAPSLRAADVGISVDNAVDVAKETADIILLKKGLKELMEGVLEGRKTFGNTMKYIMMNLSSNFGNMFSMIGASLFLPFFPMLPGQILVNNFLYDSSQLAIPSDKVDAEYLRKPKHWDIKFIKKFMIVFGPISSFFDIMTFIVLYYFFHFEGSLFQTGWFIESLATQTLVVYIIRTRKIPFIQSSPSKGLLFSTLAVVAAGIIVTLPFIGHYIGFTFLPIKAFLAILAIVITYLIVVEIFKRIFYKYYEQHQQ